MVLVEAVGKQRNPGRGVLLAAVSFSLYGFYWDVRAHEELFNQFELRRERRYLGMEWYSLAFLLPVLRFVYFYHFLGNVRYLFDREGKRGFGVGLPMTLYAGSFVMIYIVAGLIGGSIAFVGDDIGNDVLFATGLIIAASGVILGLAIRITFYVVLQGAINQIWTSYITRSRT